MMMRLAAAVSRVTHTNCKSQHKAYYVVVTIMTSPPLKPPVLKAFLGAAREYLSAYESPTAGQQPPPLPDRLASLTTAYQTLLCLELAQRGVLVKGGAPFEENGDGQKGGAAEIFDAITSAAGKVLFDAQTNSLPKPLLAACSAVMAMAAERCADIIGSIIAETSSIQLDELPANLLLLGAEADAKSSYESAKRRCSEVDDGRLSSLLDLSTNLRGPKASTPDSPPPKPAETLHHLRRYRTILLRMASGQYLRAAVEFSADDQPQMWKRCLDAVLKLNSSAQVLARCKGNDDDNSGSNSLEGDVDEYSQYETSESALPLSNLIRIASDKGNEKRASELGLRLAQSYLAGFNSDGDDSGGMDGDDLTKLSSSVKNLFWDEFLKNKSKESSTSKAKYASLAQCAIGKVEMPRVLSNTDLSDDDKQRNRLLHAALVLRSELAIEDGEIDAKAEDEWTAAKNRAEEKSGGVGRGGIAGLAKTKKQKALEEDLSRERFVRKATRTVLLDEDAHTIEDAAVVLRNEVTQDIAKLAKNESTMVDSSFELLERQMNRLIERSRSIAFFVSKSSKTKQSVSKKWSQSDCNKAWASAASFAGPILRGMDESIVAAVSKRVRHSICTIAIGVITAQWMALDVDDEAEAAFEVDRAASILSQCKDMYAAEEKIEADKRKERGDDAIGASGPRKDHDRALHIDAALSAAECRQALALASDDASVIKTIRNATALALKWEKKATSRRDTELICEVGAPFLQLLLAWSGLHRSPFSFCTVTQARSIVRYAEEGFELLSTVWGRVPTSLETMLLRLAKADVECQLPGGYFPDGEKLYVEVSSSLDDSGCDVQKEVTAVLKAHCFCGLSRIALIGIDDTTGVTQSADRYARDCLGVLNISFEGDAILSEWRDPGFLRSSASFHVCAARQLVAESMLRESKPDEAKQFLEEAVKGSPLDYDAAFALGAFRLRLVFLQGDASSDHEKKAAQTQLLKAAKLNTNKADPFALLGVWYEKQADAKRAIGCYSKALLLDATHPVAGRGMLRMKPYKEIEHLCTAATSDTSPVNGWAWKALAKSKAMDEGDDEKAAICLQQALRSRDIPASSNESLSFFFTNAHGDGSVPSDECAETWAELAFCYRRLGKYSASLRAYSSADESFGGEMLPPSVLCAWAHVELELGLFEDAVSRFEAVLETSTDKSIRPLASYGHGTAMAALSKMFVGEGKFGSAMEHLLNGIKSIETLLEDELGSALSTSACSFKLLGDLYSLATSLPPSLFNRCKTDKEDSESSDLQCCSDHDEDTLSKLSFVSKGGSAYSKAMATHEQELKDTESSDTSLLIAAASFDLGINLLCQAQVLARSLGEGTGDNTKTSMLDMAKKCKGIQQRIDESIKHFRAAIEREELFAPAWCGLGSALCYKDTLLAQHCFCRAVQIDKTIADGWSSLGLIYADRNAARPASETLDALTQVADTPFMWIGRALLLEHEEGENGQAQESNLSRASDAYRAALQVANHPEALLGLSVTARRLGLSDIMESQNDVYANSAHKTASRESHFALSMHMYLSGPCNAGARALDMVHRAEDASERLSTEHVSIGKEILNSFVSGDQLCIEDTSKMIEQLSLNDDESASINGMVQASVAAAKAMGAVCDETTLLVDDAISGEETGESQSLENARLKAHLHPDSGEYSLAYAKELVKEYTAEASASSDGKHAVSAAVDRAASLLLGEATNVHTIAPRRPIIIHQDGENGPSLRSDTSHDLSMHKSVVPMIADAALVSESLALRAWTPGEATIDTEDSFTDDDDEGVATINETESLFSLQRSLLLDPENTMARCLLEHI